MMLGCPTWSKFGAVLKLQNEQDPHWSQSYDKNLRRFLVGPTECEITGVTMTPDHKANFINVATSR